MRVHLKRLVVLASLGATVLVGAMAQAGQITIYSGRGETFVQPVIDQFQQETGIQVSVRYGDTAALAVLLQEEGARTRADLFWGQDAGAMGALARAGLLAKLPDSVYADLPEIYTSRAGEWVATTGRARVVAYSLDRVGADELPASVFDLVDERYRGRVGLAPTNGSFQSFVTAMRIQHGEERTLEWLRGLKANDAKVYRNNTTQISAIAEREIDFALINNYYLPRFTANDPNYPVGQTFMSAGDLGNMVNVAGIAVLAASRNSADAVRFIEYVLAPAAQSYFTREGNEYPVRMDVTVQSDLETMDELLSRAPVIDLDDLADLEGTLQLLRQAGWL
jgi:iron(III) transport system substrate-binding protein